jgi:hypothetical protein
VNNGENGAQEHCLTDTSKKLRQSDDCRSRVSAKRLAYFSNIERKYAANI